MKVRHAAALALVGWYLMIPPMYKNNDEPDTSAPLSEWDQWRAFDSADLCEQARDFKAKQMEKKFKVDPKAQARWMKIFGLDSRCISTDDPRLKSK